MNLTAALQGTFLAVIILAIAAYISYMIGLIVVLRRLDRLTWQAFIPILNYYAQVRAVGAPARWFFLSLTPYLGAVYAGSVAIRLGAIFGKGPAFSLFWLTFGASIGMPILARSPMLNKELYEKPIKLLDIRSIQHKLRHEKYKSTTPSRSRS